MEHVEASNIKEAGIAARKLFPDAKAQGYRLVRVDHFEDGHVVIDW